MASGLSRTASADPAATVVDLAAYREARRLEHGQLPLLEGIRPAERVIRRRMLSAAEVEHRQRMLLHLTGTP